MNKKIGFFNNDSYELALGSKEFICEPRTIHLADNLTKLYDLASQNEITLVFTTCCANRMLSPGDRDDILYIPIAKEDTEWKKSVQSYQTFYLEKYHDGEPDINGLCQLADGNVFGYNSNANELFKMLDIKEWVVFGIGVEYCAGQAIEFLFQSGHQVTFLPDVLVSNSKGTEQTRQAQYKRWLDKGAKQMNLAQLLEKFNSKQGEEK
jgi:hypothetical protein